MIVFLLANLPNAMMLINKSNHLSLAREIATKQIEDKRAISYANLTLDNPSNPPAIVDSRLNLLPDEEEQPWLRIVMGKYALMENMSNK